MDDIPLTLKCAEGGEEWPFLSYKSSVDANVEKVTPRNIHIWCPANHFFSLRKAMNTGMFTKEQANNMLASAQALVEGIEK